MVPKACRVQRAPVRFIILTRQRSASTTFVGLLNLHPEITSRWESFSSSFTAQRMRAYLGIANRSQQLADVPVSSEGTFAVNVPRDTILGELTTTITDNILPALVLQTLPP